MNYQDHFSQKCCVVTGAASGIGYAVTEELLKAGAVVYMADRNEKMLAESAAALGKLGKAIPVVVDVTNEQQVKQLVENAASEQGSIDFLFNNAGIGATSPIEEMTMAHWHRIIDVNLWSVIYGIHYTLPIMRSQKSGHIITTSSIAGLMPFPYQALYCTTKFAVAGLSESLRHELRDENIHFSVVCPGEVATRIWGTPLIGDAVEVTPPKDSIPAEEAAKTILQGILENKGFIVLPESSSQLWRQYWSDPIEFDSFMLEMARMRKETQPWAPVKAAVTG
ncbi:MAG: SDR family oxidoreductase [Firmicutes bacterium]|nr:SDR family oxidoreductase [Bacillota bacterium]